MKKILGLLLMLVSVTSYGQFVNYVNINGRYKWIAGKFDSTFTLPSGATPSLRTGGAIAPGALFYSTTDSTVYEYTGSQWRPLHGSDTGRIQIAYVRNTTASPMTTGQVVYINGSTGNVPTVALALNKQDSTSAMTFGFVRGAIPVNGFGWITTYGPIDGINTNAYTEGEVIYLDSIAGQFTHDKPQAPYHMVTLGYIIKKSGNGIIFVKIQNGYELDELHNVKITAPVLNKSVLIYDSVNSLWVDTTVSAAGLGLGGSGTTNYLSKWTSSSALGNSLVFDNGTNVGIGTASPSSKLHVVVGNVDGLRVESSNSGYLEVGKTSGGRYRLSNSYTSNDAFEILYGASGAAPTTSRFTILSNGDCLINTTVSAGYKLDVNGTIKSNGFIYASAGNLGVDNDYGVFSTGNVLKFGNGGINGTEAMRINGSRNILIGTTTDVASAILNVSSTTKGFLPPRMTNAQMLAIATPAAGLVVYDTTNNKLNVYDGTNWVAVH